MGKKKEEHGREDVGANQGPDTLVAFFRNSKGCEDTQQPEFIESMLDMDTVFEFELLVRWVPKEPEAACSVVTDGSTSTTTSSTPKDARVSAGISMSSFFTRNK